MSCVSLTHQNGKGVVAGEAVEERRRAESSKLVVSDDLKEACAIVMSEEPLGWRYISLKS